MAENVRKPRQQQTHQRTKTKKETPLSKYIAKGPVDLPFISALIIIFAVGLIMLFSASYTYSYYNRGSSYTIFVRQLIYDAIGIAIMIVVSKMNARVFRLIAVLATPIAAALLIAVLAWPEYKPGFKRWIWFGSFSFQPSEIAKIALILTLALVLEKNRNITIGRIPSEATLANIVRENTGGKVVVYKSFTYLLGYGLLIGAYAVLIYMEHHVSGTILILALGMVMLFLGEVKKGWFYIAAGAVVLVVLFVVANPSFLANYAGERITAWLDKDYDPMGARWQTNNALYAIGSGGLFGAGIGQSKQKHLYVSEPQNDFIFSIICEELGFVGAVLIIALFAYLVYRAIKIGQKAPDRFSAMLAMGIAFKVGIQVALNIAVVSDLIPNTGISLPFFSAGGTSAVLLFGEMGMILSISRSAKQKVST
ncbi:MAG: putative lipid II flippase FtsW [Clostridiales bacterium]|nr:putative lipid II flippase FtsW [Clostridiales bacterium]